MRKRQWLNSHLNDAMRWNVQTTLFEGNVLFFCNSFGFFYFFVYFFFVSRANMIPPLSKSWFFVKINRDSEDKNGSNWINDKMYSFIGALKSTVHLKNALSILLFRLNSRCFSLTTLQLANTPVCAFGASVYRMYAVIVSNLQECSHFALFTKYLRALPIELNIASKRLCYYTYVRIAIQRNLCFNCKTNTSTIHS